MRNPFEIDDSLVNIASGKVAPIDVCQESKGNRIGEQNCKNFISGQLLTDEPDLFATLKATKLKRFSTMKKKTQVVKTSKGQVVELKNDIKFASSLLLNVNEVHATVGLGSLWCSHWLSCVYRYVHIFLKAYEFFLKGL